MKPSFVAYIDESGDERFVFNDDGSGSMTAQPKWFCCWDGPPVQAFGFLVKRRFNKGGFFVPGSFVSGCDLAAGSGVCCGTVTGSD